MNARLAVAVLLVACSACENSARVVTSTRAPKVCSAATCAGCCDESGACLDGTSDDACGYEGSRCASCSVGTSCVLSACVAPNGAPVDAGAPPDAGLRATPDASVWAPADGGHVSCPPDGWCRDDFTADGGRPTQEHLSAVWATSATDVWAVGMNGTVLHSNGSSWSVSTVPFADNLYAVWASGPNDVWVGGGTGYPTQLLGMLAHYDGQAWAVVLRGTTGIAGIHGTSASDVWAVGATGQIRHFDGTSWSSVASPTTTDIVHVTALDATHAWAVGAWSLVLSWDGTSWTQVPAPSLLGGLACVHAFSPTNVIGSAGGGFVFEYDGTSWQHRNLGGDFTQLGLWGADPSRIWGVGPAGLIVESNGMTGVARVAPTGELLRDVHGADAANVWIVGFNGTILRYRP